MQSGFHSVFMVLAVWVVCLCLDDSRAQRPERDREVNQSIARGLVSGFVKFFCYLNQGFESSLDAAEGPSEAERCL